MCRPIAKVIFVGGASLHHLRPKFSVTGMIYYNVYIGMNLVRELSFISTVPELRSLPVIITLTVIVNFGGR